MALKIGNQENKNLTLSPQWAKGDNGGYYTPTVSEDGNLTWSPSEEDMPAVPGSNIAGPAGADGKPGVDGISPSVTIEQTDEGAVITVVDATGSSSATLKNGKDGVDGAPGAQGPAGQDGLPGQDGAKGEPGEGVPAGGAAGQVLAKKSGTDYDTEWVNQTGGSGGGGTVAIDNKTIIQNEDGTIGTVIGGYYTEGLVKSDYLLEIIGNGNSWSNKDISSTFTYELAKELYGCEEVYADTKSGYGEVGGFLVTKTLTTTADTEVYTFVHGAYSGGTTGYTYTGTYTISTGSWSMIANMGMAGVYYTKFYAMVPGQVAMPIAGDWVATDGDTIGVEDGKLKTTIIRITSKGGIIINNPEDSDSADESFVVGANNSAMGYGSVALGGNARVYNRQGVAIGQQLYVYGDSAFACNGLNYTRADYQHVEGKSNNWNIYSADAKYSHAEGVGNGNYAEASHVQGKYCLADTDKVYADIVGNGTDNNNRANISTLDWSGNLTLAGAVTSAGADYAEFFEWLDGNTSAEDRVGFIVALDGDKIKLAGAEDDVLGIVSATATVLGDNAEWHWNKRYLTDDFGRTIYEDRQVIHEAAYNDAGELVAEEWTEVVHAPVINPAYDPAQPYINRRNRPEWAAVGMMGKLFVRDDGTAKVNGYVTAADGIATASTSRTNMRVMKRITDNIIQVCLKG